MKNMRGKILSKLKSISNPTWKPCLSLQDFQSSNLLFFTLHDECSSISETPLDITEVKMSPGKNTCIDEKALPFISSEEKIEAVSIVERIKSTVNHDPPSLEIDTSQEKLPLISDFEDWCPPGGKEVLVLYTTSLRGIRKTFDDCNTVRFLLESFRVIYSERDVSMHLDYRHELWGILGGRVVPPRLFIRGRYIGGANEVVGLHEKGMLRDLLQGIPVSPSCTCPCECCGGMRFVVCGGCDGSRKVAVDACVEGVDSGLGSLRCSECNENGLVKCSVCC